MLKTIRLMNVLPGGKRVREGGDVWQCPVQVDNAMDVAYVKLVPLYKLVREVVCGLVAQDVGLPVVQPGVASLEDSNLDTESRYAFATLAVHTQTFPRLRDDYILRDQLSRWPALRMAIAFDEWIANPDRTFDNLLFRGPSDFLLVDHGEAIPARVSVDSFIGNRLARLAFSDVRREEEELAVKRVQTAAASFDQVDFAQIKVASLAGGWSGEEMLNECCRFLVDRLPHLDDLIVRSFGGGQQTLPLRRAAEPTKGASR